MFQVLNSEEEADEVLLHNRKSQIHPYLLNQALQYLCLFFSSRIHCITGKFYITRSFGCLLFLKNECRAEKLIWNQRNIKIHNKLGKGLNFNKWQPTLKNSVGPMRDKNSPSGMYTVQESYFAHGTDSPNASRTCNSKIYNQNKEWVSTNYINQRNQSIKCI